MKPGFYRIDKIDKRTALLISLEEREEHYTFPVADFTYEASEGDVVEVWREGTNWKTSYQEEKTDSAKSHVKDFVKKIMDQE